MDPEKLNTVKTFPPLDLKRYLCNNYARSRRRMIDGPDESKL